MKKTVKIILNAVLGLVGLVAVLLAAHPFWIGALVKGVANAKVPEITGTAFDLGAFSLNAYSGRLHVGKAQLFNPPGFKPAKAVDLGSLDISVDVGTVLSDVIVIREIALRDTFVSYVSHDGRDNFAVIAENAAKATGGDDAAETEEKKEPPSGEADEKPAEEEDEKTEKGKEKKVIIDRLLISGLKVQWGALTLPLPTIELTGIGRESDGADWATVAQEVSDAVMKHLGALGDGLIKLGGALQDVGKGTAAQALEAVKSLDVENAKKALDTGAGKVAAVTGAAVDGAGKAVEVVGDGAGKAVNVVGDGAGKAIEAVGTGATKAAEATGDALKSAGDALKGLFGK